MGLVVTKFVLWMKRFDSDVLWDDVILLDIETFSLPINRCGFVEHVNEKLSFIIPNWYWSVYLCWRLENCNISLSLN